MPNIMLRSPLVYAGKQITTVEDALSLILNLPSQKRDSHHWRAAHFAFSCASMEPAYLDTAFVALELALTLDTLVDPGLLSIPT